MFKAVVFLSLAVLACGQLLDLSAPAQTGDIIAMVNANPNSKWVAGVNARWINATNADAKRQCGVLPMPSNMIPLPFKDPITALEAAAVPDTFDSRTQWGTQCPSTKEVRDQSNCGSCWAFGAVEAMTDRLCIHSNGSVNVHLSAADMNSCCLSCGQGCNGGYPAAAWSYWVHQGLESGANYGVTPTLCFPYQLANCDHHTTGKYGPCPAVVPTPACTKTCKDGSDWTKGKHFGASSYQVHSREADIQAEIQKNGPVEAAFTVYQDFLAYKSGVYHHTTGSALGGHAVKILGWGVDAGTKYWTVANSWNEDWGNAGFFNIKRGTNECGIEGEIVAGIPKN